MITDSEYHLWLSDPNAARVILLEAEYFDGGNKKTFYAASHDYTSNAGPAGAPVDGGPYNKPYEGLLSRGVSFGRKLSDSLIGRSAVSRGDLKLVNDGRLDRLLDYWFEGQEVRLYLGSKSWERDEFRLIFKGACSGVTASPGSIALSLRDGSVVLQKDFQRPLIGGSGSNSEARSPLVFGRVFNVAPVLVDSATHTYQVHDSAVASISARDNGVPVPVADTADFANGRFRLTAAPAGEITCDVVGLQLQAVPVALEILQRAGVSDIADLSALAAAAAHEVGVYIDRDSTHFRALDEVLTGIGAFWFFDRFGVFQAGRLELAAGVPDFSLVNADIDLGGLSVRRDLPPLSSVVLGYRRNYKTQSNVAGAVSAGDRDLFGRAATFAEVKSQAVVNSYPGVEEGSEQTTALADKAGADAEAGRRLALFSSHSRLYEVKCRTAAFVAQLGQLAELTYPRYGFESSALARVVEITDYPVQGRVILGVWR